MTAGSEHGAPASPRPDARADRDQAREDAAAARERAEVTRQKAATTLERAAGEAHTAARLAEAARNRADAALAHLCEGLGEEQFFGAARLVEAAVESRARAAALAEFMADEADAFAGYLDVRATRGDGARREVAEAERKVAAVLRRNAGRLREGGSELVHLEPLPHLPIHREVIAPESPQEAATRTRTPPRSEKQ